MRRSCVLRCSCLMRCSCVGFALRCCCSRCAAVAVARASRCAARPPRCHTHHSCHPHARGSHQRARPPSQQWLAELKTDLTTQETAAAAKHAEVALKEEEVRLSIKEVNRVEAIAKEVLLAREAAEEERRQLARARAQSPLPRAGWLLGAPCSAMHPEPQATRSCAR